MKVYLEPFEVERMEEQATCLRDKLLIRLLFHLGCRVSEALGLRVEDIDFERGSVVIRHLKARTKLFCPHCGARLSITHTFCPKCGTKTGKALTQEQEHRRLRTLPVDSETLAVLQDYIRRGGPVSRKANTLIFGINRHRAWQIVRDCAQRADLGEADEPGDWKEAWSKSPQAQGCLCCARSQTG